MNEDFIAGGAPLLLADAGLKGLAVLLAAGLVALMLRRRSAASRHLVWALGLGALAALPVASWLAPEWSLEVLPAEFAVRPSTMSTTSMPPLPMADDTEVPVVAGSSGLDPSMQPVARTFSAAPAANGAAAGASWPVWIVAGWGAGVLAGLLPLLVGSVAMRRRVRRARPLADARWIDALNALRAVLDLRSDVRLFFGDPGTMPMAAGWRRPVVLLPPEAEAWPDDLRRAVLAHELAHIKRRDCLTHAFARVAAALHWPNPLAWWALRRLRAEREQACDDLALAAGARPADYADHLLMVARTLHTPRLAGAVALPMARRSQLEGRLLAILDGARRRGAVGRRLVFAGLAVVLIGSAILGTLRLKARDESGETQIDREADRVIGTLGQAPPVAVDCTVAPAVVRLGPRQAELLAVVWPDGRAHRPDGTAFDLERFVENPISRENLESWRKEYAAEVGDPKHLLLLMTVSKRADDAAGPGMRVSSLSSDHPRNVDTTNWWLREDPEERWAASFSLQSGNTSEPWPETIDVGVEFKYGPNLEPTMTIDADADRRAYDFFGQTIEATVESLAATHEEGENLPPDRRPSVRLESRPSPLPINFDVWAELQDGTQLWPYSWPNGERNKATWTLGWPEPVSQKNLRRFVYQGRIFQPVVWRNVKLDPTASGTIEASTPTVTLETAVARIAERMQALRGRKIRIEYTRTAGELTQECTLIAFGGNYRETAVWPDGRVTQHYLADGTGELNSRGQGDGVRVDVQTTENGRQLNFHGYAHMHWTDGGFPEQWTPPNSLVNWDDGRVAIRQAGEDGHVRLTRGARAPMVFSPRLGWAYMGDDSRIEFSNFATGGGFVFPGLVTVGDRVCTARAIDLDADFDPAELALPTPTPGDRVSIEVPLWESEDGLMMERSNRTSPKFCEWDRPLSEASMRWLTIAQAQWRVEDYGKALNTAYPAPFYDRGSDGIVWAKRDRDIGRWVKVHEGPALPERFGVAPWTDYVGRWTGEGNR